MTAIRLFDPERGFQRLERYELIGEIASGGMATVFLARLKGVGGFRRFFAIKCLLPHLANQHDFIDMFLDEARLAAAIRHPNVVPILEVGAMSTSHFIVMEYVEGDTLAGLLENTLARGALLPVPIGLRIALDMLGGLHAAHELLDEDGRPLQLVHRDVSPQNVLIGMDGIARITDFGIARATARLSNTREGQLKGKLAYMAPEYVQGDSSIDRRADVFSAGIVIWEALAMTRLFKSDNEAATLARVLTAKPPPLHKVAPHVSKHVSDVVMRALERNSTSRYASCAEFAEALEESAAGEMRPATQRELAKYAARVLGERIFHQRDDVRNCVARLDKLTRETTLADGRRRSIAEFRNLVSSIRVARAEATTTISTSRDVRRPSQPASRLGLPRPVILMALALFVLGLGGGVGAFIGVRATRSPTAWVALNGKTVSVSGAAIPTAPFVGYAALPETTPAPKTTTSVSVTAPALPPSALDRPRLVPTKLRPARAKVRPKPQRTPKNPYR